MHLCLEIDEIARLICSHLSPNDLVSLALTCKQLKHAALSTLWAHLPSIRPFIQLLPADAWHTCVPGYVHTSSKILARRYYPLAFSRHLEKADWISIKTAPYTGYVRKMTIGSATVSGSSLHYFTNSYDDSYGPVFPNIQHLSFSSQSEQRGLLFRSFISPTLTTLHLHAVLPTNGIIQLLSQLGTLCPLLTNFYCSLTSSSPRPTEFAAIRESISRAVVHWVNLKELDTPVLTFEGLNHISQLTSLTTLSIQCQKDIGIVQNSHVFGGGFLSLHTIVLSNCTLDHATEYLRTISATGVQIVKLTFPDDLEYQGSKGRWRDYFNAVARSSSSAASLALTVHECIGNVGGLIELFTLRPLLETRKINTLDFPDCHYFDLSDDFIEDVAKALPQLTLLNIGTRCRGVKRKLTLKAYVHVFKHCPRITTLGFVLKTSGNDKWMYKPIEGQFARHGKEFCLYVGESTVKNPQAVACLLSQFFNEPPEAVAFSDNPYIGEVDQSWATVLNLLAEWHAKRNRTFNIDYDGFNDQDSIFDLGRCL